MKQLQLRLILLLLFPFTSGINAQSFDVEKLDSFLRSVETFDQGMNSLSVFRGGREVYTNTIGFADVENGLRANAGTKYRIGSISKSFTAVVVMKLVEQGKISLDTPLSDFFPEVANADKITIEQMLRHQSGIFSVTNEPDYLEWAARPISREDMVAKIKSHPSEFEPGTTSDYSNSNYILLTYIAEELTDKSFADLVQTYICEVCNLEDTYYGGKIDPNNNEAFSYGKYNGWVKGMETDMSVPAGAGAIVSNPKDLNTFTTCLHAGKLVSGATLSKMMEIEKGFGIGLFTLPFNDKISYGHTGGIDGFQSNAFYFPEEDVAVAMVANGVSLPVNDILIGVLSIYFNLDFDLPDLSPKEALSDEVLALYPGVYSSDEFPLDITVSVQGNQLFCQATGQGAFPVDVGAEEHEFVFRPAGIEMRFDPEAGTMTFSQGGGTYTLAR